MHSFRNYLWIAFCCCYFSPLTALGFSGEATDRAFAALLSMPSAKPETGYWKFPDPEDFTDRSEAGLVAYLQQKQADGADFNAFRHFGSLLHHAIRANLQRTAIWLLKHGADPYKLQHDQGINAFGLALQYKRQTLLAFMQQRYGAQAVKPLTQKPVQPVNRNDAPTTTLDYTSEADLRLARTKLIALSIDATYPYNHLRQQRTQGREKIARFFAALPEGALPRLLDDSDLLSRLSMVYREDNSQLDRWLASLPPEILQKHAQTLLSEFARYAHIQKYVPEVQYTYAPDLWKTLWRYLPKPLDYSEWQDLAGRIQPELWPMLFESGYGIRDAEVALDCMLSGISAKQLKSDWPQLEKTFPNLRDAAPNLVLAGFRLSGCGTTDIEDKVAFLNAIGIKGKINAVNWEQIGNPYVSDPKAVAAIQPFLPKKGDLPGSEPRLVDDTSHCTFELDDVWYHYLLNTPKTLRSKYDTAPVETEQLIEVPGQDECGLFVSGNRWTINGGVFDSFTGPDEDPRASCPDPPDEYEIVSRSGGHIEHLPTDMGSGNYAPLLLPIKDRVTGQRYYMNTGRPDEMCQPGVHLPEIYRWQQRKDGWVLAAVTDKSLENVLRSQCVMDDRVVCAGFAALGKTASLVSEAVAVKKTLGKQDAYLGAMTVNGFIDAFRAPQRQAFLAAVMALDREALKRFRSEGMPSSWISDAISAVGQSKLPLQDKRQRIAWLFYDHTLLSQAMTKELLAPLLKWLPREDWGPVLSSIDGLLVGQLVNDGIVKDRQKLECDIAHARNEICGETWGAEEVPPEEAQ